MKPDWKDAPEWANYLAQDDDGGWYWFENKPDRFTENGFWESEEGCWAAVCQIEGWENSLEQRP